MFIEKNILVGISGGIAVYKTAELVREFKKNGANVRVIMTKAATDFVSPITFETLSEYDVLTDLFPEGYSKQAAHIDWARWADIFIICPATLNTIGKVASGIADNALTTTIMAAQIPVVFCPAMNKAMYANPIHQNNQQKLVDYGYTLVEPGEGELACGEVGQGRLADKGLIVNHVKKILYGSNEFSDKKILISAGPTKEPIDPVRYLTNRSSGKMGFALAERAAIRGAEVVLVSGPTDQEPFPGVTMVPVQTALDMQKALNEHIAASDILIMAAAVSDYRPAQYSATKVKKGGQDSNIAMTRNPDILAGLGEKKNKRIHVGFSVETENEIKSSLAKLKSKHCDLMVMNNPLEKDAGFQGDNNKVTLIDINGKTESLPVMSKFDVADAVLDRILLLDNGK